MKISVSGGVDFATRLAADATSLRSAAALSVQQAAEGLKAELRAQVVGAGLGQRLANTWRVAYRTGQRQALVYTRAPAIMKGHNQASVIRSSDGFWLALPGPGAPAHVGGGLRPTPERVERMYGRPLAFVYRSPPPSLLVMSLRRGTGARGGWRSPSARALATGDTEAAVMFLLFPLVRLPKRLDVEGAVRRWHAALPGLLDSNWRRAA